MCKDLINLRSPTATLNTCLYIRHDLPSHSRLRARLRLNRSYLNDSLFRCQYPGIHSPHCSLCLVNETPSHLLICPRYHSARLRLIHSIGHLPSINTILAELPTPTSTRQRHRQIRFLHLTGKFLTDVAILRSF